MPTVQSSAYELANRRMVLGLLLSLLAHALILSIGFGMVTIVRSSGCADLDEAVRRIVHLNARYAAFPPNVAARFDVIEIRRV